MIAYAEVAFSSVPAVYFFRADVHAGFRCGAVDYDCVYFTHLIINTSFTAARAAGFMGSVSQFSGIL